MRWDELNQQQRNMVTDMEKTYFNPATKIQDYIIALAFLLNKYKR